MSENPTEQPEQPVQPVQPEQPEQPRQQTDETTAATESTPVETPADLQQVDEAITQAKAAEAEIRSVDDGLLTVDDDGVENPFDTEG